MNVNSSRTSRTPRSQIGRLSLLALAIGGTLAALALAGPLTPPAGPVTSTYKTLQEVEPRTAVNATNTPGDASTLFRITQPGSYYLTGNITGVAARHGIEIASSGVTLDLNGFELIGVTGSFSGVIINAASSVSVRNGSIRSWGQRGADAATFGATNVSFTDLKVAFCGGSGIRAHTDAEVTRCMVASNGAEGIFVNTGSTVIGCTATGNSIAGIASAGDSTIIQCTSSDNIGDGFNVGSGCTVSQCTASGNSNNGIRAFTGCTITSCTTKGNVNHGIYVGYHCSVLNNTSALNGVGPAIGAGIFVQFHNNRIEGNVCNASDRGIHVSGLGNVVIRNTCSGNTTSNWLVSLNNIVGPVIDRTAPGSPGFSTNSFAGSTATTDPNANFTH